MNDALNNLSREELLELVEIYAKNLIALDGTWFQSVEKSEGMDAAMLHDREAWRNFEASEGRRIKKFLGLEEHPGLEGLAAALPLRCQGIANPDALELGDGYLLYRIVDCRVQSARTRKGMDLHPCKSAGLEEFGCFAAAIDDRIDCECVSCYPDVTDASCGCAWRFTLRE